MSSNAPKAREHEWLSYYDRFSYFSPGKVRDGCYPRIKEHSVPAKKAIVLVHGLSDSPYFMTAIGDFFFNNLGYNVYMPLLHCHGLKEPKGMEEVDLEEWKANLVFAIKTAAAKAGEISVGGLSTGGTLGFYMAAINPMVNGGLYLFSAALDLAGGRFGLLGELKERLLRTFLAVLFDSNKPLIGDNPYRYSRVDMDGAEALARLIKKTDCLVDVFSEKVPFPKKTFAAHSECDTTAQISGIEKLQKISVPEQFNLFRIPEQYKVAHASVVLKEPVMSGDEILEKQNPLFQEMMDAIAAFQ